MLRRRWRARYGTWPWTVGAVHWDLCVWFFYILVGLPGYSEHRVPQGRSKTVACWWRAGGNEKDILDLGGLQALFFLLKKHAKVSGICDAACGAIRNLTCRNGELTGPWVLPRVLCRIPPRRAVHDSERDLALTRLPRGLLPSR
jgi:hypothetical protein